MSIGVADEKHIRLEYDSSQTKVKPLDIFKFKTNSLLEPRQKIRPFKTSVRYKTSPDSLVELCSTVVNAIPLPSVFQWSALQVADLIRKLGFPQYQNTFRENCINGRTLLRMDTSYLVKINIKNLDHIQIIRNCIHQLFGLQRSCFNRNMTLPDRTPDALYKFFRMSTGPKYHKTRPTDLYRIHNLLRPSPPYETHWQTLERMLKHLRPVETELVGGAIRKNYNLYYPKTKISDAAPTRKKHHPNCACMPPCMCEWNKEKVVRKPWTLKCLQTTYEKSEQSKCVKFTEVGLTCLKVHIHQKNALDDLQTFKGRSSKIVSPVNQRTFHFHK